MFFVHFFWIVFFFFLILILKIRKNEEPDVVRNEHMHHQQVIRIVFYIKNLILQFFKFFLQYNVSLFRKKLRSWQFQNLLLFEEVTKKNNFNDIYYQCCFNVFLFVNNGFGLFGDVLGTVGTTVRQLESDLRAVMQPHTATNLKVKFFATIWLIDWLVVLKNLCFRRLWLFRNENKIHWKILWTSLVRWAWKISWYYRRLNTGKQYVNVWLPVFWFTHAIVSWPSSAVRICASSARHKGRHSRSASPPTRSWVILRALKSDPIRRWTNSKHRRLWVCAVPRGEFFLTFFFFRCRVFDACVLFIYILRWWWTILVAKIDSSWRRQFSKDYFHLSTFIL